MNKYVRKGWSSLDFQLLIGLTFTEVHKVDSKVSYNDAIRFHCDDGRVFELSHVQDCCEGVYIESVEGSLKDLVGSPILLAEEATSSDNPKDQHEESFTWTFYKLATHKGYVDIRFYGSSNGYYSESADLYEVRLSNVNRGT